MKKTKRNLHSAISPASLLAFVRLREVMGDVLCLKRANAGVFGGQLRSYQAVLKVSSINFSLMSEREQESILAGYRVLINSLRHYGVDIHIRIEPYDLDEYEERVRSAESQANAREIEAHIEYVRDLASKRALIQRHFYLIVPADDLDVRSARRKTPEERIDIARTQLKLRCDKIIEELSRMGLVAHRMDKKELVNYYRACWHSSARKHPLSANQIAAAEHIVRPKKRSQEKGRNSSSKEKDLTTPMLKDTLPGLIRLAEISVPSSLELERTCVAVNAYGEDEYASGIAIVGLPAYVNDGFLARLIEIDEPNIDMVLSLRPQEATPYKNKLRRKLVGYRGTQHFDARRGRGENHDIKVAAEEVNELLEELARQTEYVYSQRFHILVRARSKTELREREQRVFAMLTTLELTGVSTTWEHHLALRATLPEGNRVLANEKVLDTSSVVTGFPFTSEVLSTGTGLLTGLGPDGSLVILDPFSEELENANLTLFAKSGAGKSFSQKVAIYRAWLQGIACAVIDPEQEFLRLCKKIKGEYVTLDVTNLRINPFDLFAAIASEKERNLLEEKVSEILPLFDLLLADSNASLLKTETSLLHRCILRAYSQRDITPDPATHHKQPPNMKDIYDLLNRQECGEDSSHLAERLERYVPLFPETTQVSLDSQSLFFSIRDLNTELRPAGVFLITSYIWTQMRRRRENARKWLLYIDEAWSLMEFEEGGRFLANVARRARKYGLGVVTITQNVEDFLNDPNGRAILSNSSITLLMKQAPETIDSVVSAFHLSESERKYLLAASKGEALISARGSRVPLQIVASPVEYTFAVSDPAELLRIAELENLIQVEETTEPSTAVAIRNGDGGYNVIVSTGRNNHAELA